MSKRVIKYTLACVGIISCALAASISTAAEEAQPPTQAETFGYLQWLHSLETEVVAQREAGLEGAAFLFPFERPAWDLENPRPYRHLSISKAVTELEAAGEAGERGNIDSSLMALANARNYANLSEYDHALAWYQAAAELDSAGSFRHEIGRERLACAISVRDTLAIAEWTTNLLGATDLTGYDDELILVYRWSLSLQDVDAVNHLAEKLDSHPDIVTSRLRFWQGYALQWLGERERALSELRKLVLDGGLSNGLTAGQRGWVLQAIADDYFLLGEHEVAGELYQALNDCRVPALRYWGKYQLAGLDFIAARFLAASNKFQEVCEAERFGSWQDQACAMQEITRNLTEVKGEGEPYGVASFYGP